MKSYVIKVYFIVMLCLVIFPISALAVASNTTSTSVTLDDLNYKAPGNSVVLRGTSIFTSVTIHVLRPDGVELYTKVAQVNNGIYEDSFTIPTSAPSGNYKVYVGRESTVVVKDLNVISLTVFHIIDANQDNKVGVDDLISFILNGGTNRDLNSDGVFDRADIVILLNMIQPISN